MALGGGGQTSRLTEVVQTRHQKEMMNPFLICRLRRCYPDTLRKGGQNRRQESCHAVYNSQWFWVVDVCSRSMYASIEGSVQTPQCIERKQCSEPAFATATYLATLDSQEQ